MVDPLSQVIALLRPQTVFTKIISGAGRWGVRYTEFGSPSFSVVMEGGCRLTVDGGETVTLAAGDFVMFPATPGLVMTGFEPVMPTPMTPVLMPSPTGEIRHGRRSGPADVRLLGGCFVFDSPDAALLVSLLPAMIHVRGVPRLTVLVEMLREESGEERPGRELILSRLVELLLIESIRATRCKTAPPGLIRGLGDPRLATAIRLIHGDPAKPWTVTELARASALSRSVFFDRFTDAVGMPPMEYLLGWRMALAKDMLRRGELSLSAVAERVGYGSASTFSTAFSRHVGLPPGRFAREAQAA